MSPRKKHWMQIGRVKNSEWFRSLPTAEKAAVIASLEEETFESSQKLRAALAIIYSAIVYGGGGFFWGSVFGHSQVGAIGGTILGAVLGVLAADAIFRQKTAPNAAAMQSITGLVIGLPGFVIACAGLIAWLVGLAFRS